VPLFTSGGLGLVILVLVMVLRIWSCLVFTSLIGLISLIVFTSLILALVLVLTTEHRISKNAQTSTIKVNALKTQDHSKETLNKTEDMTEPGLVVFSTSGQETERVYSLNPEPAWVHQ